MERALLRPRRRPRRVLPLLCLTSLAVLCLGWTGLWLFARHEAAHAMDGWIADEAGRGRQWTCPARTITGFPFTLSVACAHPSFQGRVGGEDLDVAAAGLRAFAYLYQPDGVEASLDSPVTIAREGRERPAVLSWSRLNVTARQLGETPARFEVQIDDPVVDDLGVAGKAAHAEIHVTPEAGAAARDKTYKMALRLDRASLPSLDEALRDPEPLTADLTGTLSHTLAAGGEPWQALVERWRQAGGLGEISRLDILKGDMRAEVMGTLGLDEAHRLAGRLRLRGSGALLAHVLDLKAAQAAVPFALSIVLKTILSRTPPRQLTDPVPVSLADGRVSIGSMPTPQRLAPLY